MSDQEINIAIAEACGWTDIEVAPYDMMHVERGDLHGEFEGRWSKIPDFSADLNAMHETCEATFGNSDAWTYFVGHLCEVAQALHCSEYDALIITSRANARQRAEAFLKTLGKWKEGE